MSSKQRLYEQEIDTCLVCKKQPIPESKQELMVLAAGVFCFLWSFRLALVLVLLSYYFSKIVWKCPLCKRQIEVATLDAQVQENLILRCGNCLVMLSKRKYLAAVSIVALLLFVTRPAHPTKQLLEAHQLHEIASWESLANHTGKEAMLDNEHHARNQFEKYTELGDWLLRGYYMRSEDRLPTGHHVVLLRMSPTQNRNPSTPDIILNIEEPIPQGTKPGDQLEFRGQAIESFTNYYLFHAFELKKTGTFRELSTIAEFDWMHDEKLNNLRNEDPKSAVKQAPQPEEVSGVEPAEPS